MPTSRQFWGGGEVGLKGQMFCCSEGDKREEAYRHYCLFNCQAAAVMKKKKKLRLTQTLDTSLFYEWKLH